MSSPLRIPAAPSVEATTDPGATLTPSGRLTAGGLALWELERAEVAAKNAALVAAGLKAERAAMDAARTPALREARAREDAAIAADDHRAAARQWAAEHPGVADRMPELQAQARAKAAGG